MGTIGRVAFTAGTALLLGAYCYANAFDLHGDGTLATIAYSTPFGVFCFLLPALTAAIVSRWWALAVALVPFAVQFYLHEMTDYSYPYHEDPYPGLSLMATFVFLAIASFGFLARLVFDRVRANLPTS